jgi:hypothetical protein
VRTEPGSAEREAPGWQCGCGGPASDFGRVLRAHSYECDECDSGTVDSPATECRLNLPVQYRVAGTAAE